MANNIFQITHEKFKGGYEGEALLINYKEIKKDFDYIGLWYALDKNEKIFITTEIFYSDDEKPIKPIDFNDELKETQFKNSRYYRFVQEKNWIWISTRVDNDKYCKIKIGSIKDGKLFITYKVLHNKTFGFDILKNGLFKGGSAKFFPIGIEDRSGKIPQIESVMYLVMINDLPPSDWGLTENYIGVENLPILAQIYKFADDKKYSDWLLQNPLS